MSVNYLPKISIVTAVLNAAAHVERTIESVLTQRYPNLEYIIIDGGSSDGTLDIIHNHRQRLTAWRSEPDGGVYDAWNKGLALASGEWIGFLGAGDEYTTDAIAKYVDAIQTHSDKQLEYISSQVALVADAGQVLRTIGLPWEWRRFQVYMNVAHVGSLHHRRLYDRYGRYDLSYRVCGDYELLLRPRERLRAAYFPHVTAHMRLSGLSNTDDRVFTETARAKRDTGGRSGLLCRLDNCMARAKYALRKLVWRRHGYGER